MSWYLCVLMPMTRPFHDRFRVEMTGINCIQKDLSIVIGPRKCTFITTRRLWKALCCLFALMRGVDGKTVAMKKLFEWYGATSHS